MHRCLRGFSWLPIVLQNMLAGQREKAIKAYAVLDEQSNRSLAKTELFNLFGIETGAAPYTLKTCSGVVETSRQQASDLIV